MEVSAAQRALSIPEILAEIFMWICTKRRRAYALKYLARCGRVNKTWFNEAMRLLWIEPVIESKASTYHPSSLVLLFAKTCSVERRQFYANFIQKANLHTVGGYVGAQSNYMLRDIVFPSLRSVRILIDNKGHRLDVPILMNHRITDLEFEPSRSKSRHEIDKILEQIPDVFPHLERIRVVDRARVDLESLERLKSRLPYLMTLEDSEYHIGEGRRG